MTERIPLFSNSTEYDDWMEANCKQCSKYRSAASEPEEFLCDIDQAIQNCLWDGGCVDEAIAERMGWEGVKSPCGEKALRGTGYRLPLDKLKLLATVLEREPQLKQTFTPETMEENFKLLDAQCPEFLLGFASASDWILASFRNFMKLSQTADVPVIYFEKIVLSMAIAASQKYLEEKKL